MLTLPHKQFGELVLAGDADELTQGQVVAFMTAMNDLRPAADAPESRPAYYGRVLKAAIRAGWVVEPALVEAQVEAMPARRARWYGKSIDDLYAATTNVDPN